MKKLTALFLAATAGFGLAACDRGAEENATARSDDGNAYVMERIDIYAPVKLTADLSALSGNQRALIGKLIEASEIMDDLFWKQAYGDRNALLNSLQDENTRRFAEINYGPWDRLAGDRP